MMIINYKTLVAIALCMATAQLKAQQIIAHRGASFRAPENTVAAVKLGYELEADAVEIDVFLSKDNRIMVNHDADTKRTGGEALKIRETNADELRKLDVGSWKSSEYEGEKMPFLEEILAIVPQHQKLVIEIKTGEEIMPFLDAALSEHNRNESIVIISFSKAAILKAAETFPDIPCYWLLHNFNLVTMEEAITIAKDNALRGLNFNYKLVDAKLMQAMKTAGLETLVYTVNDQEDANKLQELNVDGITTDRPMHLRKALF